MYRYCTMMQFFREKYCRYRQKKLLVQDNFKNKNIVE